MRDLTGADGATFILRQGNHCYYADEDAIAPLWKGQRFAVDACLSGWTMLNRQPAVIENIYADPRIPHDVYRPTFVKSLVMTPIRTVAPIGAIRAYWATQHHPSEQEIELLQALADSASIALEAVDLGAHLEQRVTEAIHELHRSRADLEAAHRELEEFSFSVAHDLRSPLIAIDGFANDSLEHCAHTFDEESREYLARISTAVSRMHRLIEALLSLSKISLAPLQPAPVDLSSLARESASSFQERASHRHIELEIADGMMVQGDPQLLPLVVENLLANAWNFTSRRQSARVEFGWRDLAGGERAFFVRDNGAGFDPRFAEKLYRPSTACIPRRNFRAWRASGWRSRTATSAAMAASCGPNPRRDRGATFYFTDSGAAHAAPRVKAQSSTRLASPPPRLAPGNVIQPIGLCGCRESLRRRALRCAPRGRFLHTYPAWPDPPHRR